MCMHNTRYKLKLYIGPLYRTKMCMNMMIVHACMSTKLLL